MAVCGGGGGGSGGGGRDGGGGSGGGNGGGGGDGGGRGRGGGAAFPQHARRDDRLEKSLLLLSGCGASIAHSQHHRLPQLSIEVWAG